MLIFVHPFGLSLQLYRVTLRVFSRPSVMEFLHTTLLATLLHLAQSPMHCRAQSPCRYFRNAFVCQISPLLLCYQLSTLQKYGDFF